VADFRWERVDLACRMAWLARRRAAGCLLDPTKPETLKVLGFQYNDGLLTGYAHDDSVEVVVQGPLRVLSVGADPDVWIRDSTLVDVDLVDTYWDVEPVGWTPRCPSTGEPLSSCWIFGPTVCLPKDNP